MNDQRPKRRWFQFSLRALLVFVLLVSSGMSWLAVRRHRVRRQREAVKAIRELGGRVEYEEAETRVPSSLRELFGDDFFVVKVHRVGFDGTRVSDAALEHLEGLITLKSLALSGTQVTDAGLEHIKGMSDLGWLHLNGTQVTDAGLEHLKGLTNLQWLNLSRTHVTDAGLEHLKGLTNLKWLELDDTQVTDAGVDELIKALQNCRINW